MPFNGSGVYVRTENWTNDANNNLPISATKFDTEANDMATAFGLCLTRDGQGVPVSPLTWTQMLTVAMAADAAAIVAGRTGGSNNPQIQLKLADATGGIINLTTAQALALAIAGTNVLTVNGTSVVAAQPISSSRASDGTVFTLSRTGGTHNPALTVTVNDAAQTFTFAIGGTSVMTLSSTGITAPSFNKSP